MISLVGSEENVAALVPGMARRRWPTGVIARSGGSMRLPKVLLGVGHRVDLRLEILSAGPAGISPFPRMPASVVYILPSLTGECYITPRVEILRAIYMAVSPALRPLARAHFADDVHTGSRGVFVRGAILHAFTIALCADLRIPNSRLSAGVALVGSRVVDLGVGIEHAGHPRLLRRRLFVRTALSAVSLESLLSHCFSRVASDGHVACRS